MEYQKTNKKYQKKTKRLNTKKSKKMKRVSKVSKKYQKFQHGGKTKPVRDKSGSKKGRRSISFPSKFSFGSKITNPEIQKYTTKIEQLRRIKKQQKKNLKNGVKISATKIVKAANIHFAQTRRKEAVEKEKKVVKRRAAEAAAGRRAVKTAKIARAAAEAAKVAGTKKAKKTAEKAAEKAKKAKRRQLYEQIKIKGEAGELKSKEMQAKYTLYKPVKNTANTHRRVIKGLAPFGGLVSAIHYGYTRGNIQKKKTQKEALIDKYEEELKEVEKKEAENISKRTDSKQLEILKEQAIASGHQIVEKAASKRIAELTSKTAKGAPEPPLRQAETVRRPPGTETVRRPPGTATGGPLRKAETVRRPPGTAENAPAPPPPRRQSEANRYEIPVPQAKEGTEKHLNPIRKGVITKSAKILNEIRNNPFGRTALKRTRQLIQDMKKTPNRITPEQLAHFKEIGYALKESTDKGPNNIARKILNSTNPKDKNAQIKIIEEIIVPYLTKAKNNKSIRISQRNASRILGESRGTLRTVSNANLAALKQKRKEKRKKKRKRNSNLIPQQLSNS